MLKMIKFKYTITGTIDSMNPDEAEERLQYHLEVISEVKKVEVGKWIKE